MRRMLKILEEEILVQSGEEGVRLTWLGRLLGRTGFLSASVGRLQPGLGLGSAAERSGDETLC